MQILAQVKITWIKDISIILKFHGQGISQVFVPIIILNTGPWETVFIYIIFWGSNLKIKRKIEHTIITFMFMYV